MARNKYHARKARTADGNVHASGHEAQRWRELQLMQTAGLIMDLQRQVKFVLIPSQYETYPRYGKKGKRLKDGKRCIEKECSYYADFVYIDVITGETIVEDAKGYRTEEYKIKRKLMLYVHGIRIVEV